MLIDKNDLDRTLQRGTESIQRSVRIRRKIVPSNDGLVSSLSIVDVSFDSKSFSVVLNTLPEDGDSRFERNDERNYTKRQSGSMREMVRRTVGENSLSWTDEGHLSRRHFRLLRRSSRDSSAQLYLFLLLDDDLPSGNSVLVIVDCVGVDLVLVTATKSSITNKRGWDVRLT